MINNPAIEYFQANTIDSEVEKDINLKDQRTADLACMINKLIDVRLKLDKISSETFQNVCIETK